MKLSFAILPLFITGLLFCSCDKKATDGFNSVKVNPRSLMANEQIPEPQREFRAAWVATVNNIDWPSKPGLPANEQQREALAILDELVKLNMNAVIFQARPQADTFYQSKTEPWSYYLTGEQGKKPSYDPMAFWIREAHKRGLLFHAWMNPFRANHKSHKGPISSESVITRRPEWVVKLGSEGYIWLNPTNKDARQYSKNVILEVVQNYDIDGLHIDDYFYPYPSYNNGRDFPDQADYDRYRKSGGKLGKDDWRRDAVNTMVRELHIGIKRTKPHVEFGISPFGIWRPGYPSGISGLDQYKVLYADAKLWLNEGWLDYFAPQLYWPISQKGQSFSTLLGWWNEQNTQQRHLWPGLTLVNSDSSGGVSETTSQILYNRNLMRGRSGICLFSMNWLTRPRLNLPEKLAQGPLAAPAIVPQTPWIKSSRPVAPKVELRANSEGQYLARFKPGSRAEVFQYVLNEKRNGQWQPPVVIPAMYRSYPVKPGIESIAVRTSNRFRNLSEFSLVDIGN